MYQVGIKNRFRAGHFLVGDFAEETQPHEHEYVVEWICSANVLDENGFAVNIAIMEEELQAFVERIRGTMLNSLSFFKDRQVSVENMAHFICDTLVDRLKERGVSLDPIQAFQVKIWESETAWAAYIQT